MAPEPGTGATGYQMKAKKILFILHLPPPVHGASQIGQYIRDSNSIRNAFDCHFISLSSAKKLSEIGRFSILKILLLLKLYWRVFRFLLLNRTDLCYITLNSHGGSFFKDAGIALITRMFRRKTIYHFHNKGIRNYQDKFIYNLAYKAVFKKAHALLLSPLLYPDIKKYLPPERVHYCANGIPVHPVKPHSPQQEKCRILFLSNMMKAKGVLDLIEACKLLKKEGLSFHCDFVGKWFDVDEAQFKSLVSTHELNDYVCSHGAQFGNDKEVFYSEADLFVFPSHNEAYPLVLLEAMQHKLPVISTKVGAIPEIVDEEHTGLLVKSQNPAQLALAMSRLIREPETRDRFGDAGYKKFCEHFTLNIFEQKLKIILSEITGANEGDPPSLR